MNESTRGFLDFLRSVDLRVFQEREVGLDLYLSGFWAIVPAALAIASATVFLLAIFQWIPSRKHSIPLLVAAGVVAGGIGLGGAWLNFRAYAAPQPVPPRVLLEGKGGSPGEHPGQTEALLALPLLVGGTTLAADLGGSLFLLVFWGGAEKKKAKAPAPAK